MRPQEVQGFLASSRTRTVACLAAVTVCAMLEFAADMGFMILRDGHGPAGYSLLIIALSAVFAVGLAVVSSVSSHAVALTLVGWTAFHGLGGGRLRIQIVCVIVLGLITWVGSKLAARHSRNAGFLGLVAGTALAVGWVGARWAIRVFLPETEPSALVFIAAPIAAHAVAFGCVLMLLHARLSIHLGKLCRTHPEMVKH